MRRRRIQELKTFLLLLLLLLLINLENKNEIRCEIVLVGIVLEKLGLCVVVGFFVGTQTLLLRVSIYIAQDVVCNSL